MKLLNELFAGAVDDEKKMGELAAEGQRNLSRQKAYDRLNSTLDQMAADGYFDEGELDELKTKFREMGLDTASIEQAIQDLKDQDGTGRVAAGDLAFELHLELSGAKSDATLGPEFNLEVQSLLDAHNQKVTTIAEIQASEQKKYMNCINNLKA